MKLVIGNKNYSSWSMRPWLLMTALGIPFEEEKLSFADPGWKSRALRYSPTGMVPVLVDGDLAVWDTLAITEYLAEKFPERGVWPAAAAARARARSIVAEMHSGFQAIRDTLQMNCELRVKMQPLARAVRREIQRVFDIWSDCRTQVGPDAGPFLFGGFSAADAFYAPITRRFVSYGVDCPEVARRYIAAVEALPATRAWLDGAMAEREFIDWEEPYRERA